MPAFPDRANSVAALFDTAGTILPVEATVAAIEALGRPEEAISAFGLGLPAFAFVIAASPGPSNLILLSIGSRNGLRGGATVLGGLALGYAVMWGAAGSGLRAAATLDPTVMRLAQGAALALMVLMAWKLVTIPPGPTQRAGPGAAGPSALVGGEVRGLLGGFAFQWINPKAWVSALAAAALFCSPEMNAPSHAAWFGLVAGVAVLAGCGLWLAVGARGSLVLERPRFRAALNGALAVTLLASVVPLVAI